MHANRRVAFLSYVMIAGGVLFLFLGARDFLESRFGQTAASETFEEARPPELKERQPLPAPSIGDTIAKLIIPRLGAELYVVEGDGPRELRRAPGHLPGTALPGVAGNCIIAGHRDTHFRILRNVREGDEIILQSGGEGHVYRVKSTSVISPTETSVLRPTRHAELNLITCYPFYYVGSAPKRFVVEAILEDRNTAPLTSSLDAGR